MKNPTILLFNLLLFINLGQAQKHSAFRFNPQFNKDSIKIVNIDSLHFDLNLIILEGRIEDISITGKLGFIYNHFRIKTSYKCSFRNDSIKTVSLTSIDSKNKYMSDYEDMNLMNYKIRYNKQLYFPDPNYSLEKIKQFVRNNDFSIFNLNFDNIIFICTKKIPKKFHDSPDFIEVNCGYEKEWQFKFSKLDLRNINIYDEKGISIIIPYQDLMPKLPK